MKCTGLHSPDNVSKHAAKATQKFLKSKKLDIFQLPGQSPNPSPIEHAFQSLKKKLKPERTPQTSKEAIQIKKDVLLYTNGPNCTEHRRAGMANSFYILDHIKPIVILIGPDQ